VIGAVPARAPFPLFPLFPPFAPFPPRARSRGSAHPMCHPAAH